MSISAWALKEAGHLGQISRASVLVIVANKDRENRKIWRDCLRCIPDSDAYKR